MQPQQPQQTRKWERYERIKQNFDVYKTQKQNILQVLSEDENIKVYDTKENKEKHISSDRKAFKFVELHEVGAYTNDVIENIVEVLGVETNKCKSFQKCCSVAWG